MKYLNFILENVSSSSRNKNFKKNIIYYNFKVGTTKRI